VTYSRKTLADLGELMASAPPRPSPISEPPRPSPISEPVPELIELEPLTAPAGGPEPKGMLKMFVKTGNPRARPKPKPAPKVTRTIGTAADAEVLAALELIRTKLGAHVAPCFRTNGALLKMALLRLARDFA
jgi:hypothetical protein